MKDPSADVNPANQLGSLIIQSKFGLSTGIILGKAAFNSSDNKPRFIEDLIARIFLSPSIVICFLLLTKSKTFLNKR